MVPYRMPLSARTRRRLFLVAAPALALAVLAFVDLSPEVGRDFFFSSSDPRFQEDRRIRAIFPTRDHVLISARAPDPSGARLRVHETGAAGGVTRG